MTRNKAETSQELPVNGLLLQLASNVRELQVPAVLNEETIPQLEDIFYALIAVEKALWDIDEEKMGIRQGGEVDSIRGNTTRESSLCFILALTRTILQMCEPSCFNPEGAEKIANNMQKLSLILHQLAERLTRASQAKDPF